ncbi:MAG: gamma-glutamyl-gamma-aminobutyrate hydrolase family protein [Candidatus Berkelbacteria bacterium]
MKKILIIEHAPGRAENIDRFIGDIGVRPIVWPAYLEDRPKGDFDGLVIAGGPMNAIEIIHSRESGFRQEMDFIYSWLSDDRPTLGVCLGCQILGHLFGGCLAFNQAWQRGWYQIELSLAGKNDPLLANCPDAMTFFEYHQDKVAALPPGAILLASTSNNMAEIFKMKDKPVWAVQSHIEIHPLKAQKIFELMKEKLKEEGLSFDQEIGRGFESYREECSRTIFQNFVNLI